MSYIVIAVLTIVSILFFGYICSISIYAIVLNITLFFKFKRIFLISYSKACNDIINFIIRQEKINIASFSEVLNITIKYGVTNIRVFDCDYGKFSMYKYIVYVDGVFIFPISIFDKEAIRKIKQRVSKGPFYKKVRKRIVG